MEGGKRFEVEVYNKGSRGRDTTFSFSLVWSSGLLRFCYEAGFGEKTAMGFGCAEVVVGDGRRRGGGERCITLL